MAKPVAQLGAREAAIAGGLAAFFAVGFAGGRLTAPLADASGAARDWTPPAAVRGGDASDATEVATRVTSPRSGAASRAGCGHDHSLPEGADPFVTEVEADAERPPLDVGPLLAAARASRAAPDDHDAQQLAGVLAHSLVRRLLADPTALEEALAQLARLHDPDELADLAAVLGQIRDPEVEAAALALAGGAGTAAQRTAALHILDALDAPAAREVALSILANETDRELRRAALHAIPEPEGIGTADAASVTATLVATLANDPDEEAARRAVVLLGRWRRDDSDLAPVLHALSNDPRAGVRAGAAFALEVAGARSPSVVTELAAALTREDEDPVVRENAWRALSALSPLPDDARRAWRAYADARQAEGEGSFDAAESIPSE